MKTKFEKRIAFDLAHILPRKYKNLHNVPHWHKEHELIFVQSGEVSLTTEGEGLTLSTGTAAFVHSEQPHSIEASHGAVVTVLKLDAAYFHRIVGEKRLEEPILRFDYGLPALFRELFAELKAPMEYSDIVADSLASGLMARIFRQERVSTGATARKDSMEQYKALLALIERDHTYITFEDAANFMHFSKPYFSEFFLRHAGMSFTRYLNTVKISAAVERLQEGRMSVTEISKGCGFNTIRNFNRVFKELTGYTPNQLPESYRFTYSLKEYADSGFDPTLLGSELLET